MSYESKQRLKDNFKMIPWVIVYIILQVIIIIAEARQHTMFNGVLSALQYGTCLMLLRTNHKRGVIVSTIMMGLTSLMMLRIIIFVGDISAVPGLCNMIFYIITMLILTRYYDKRESEAITDYLTGVLNRRGLYKHLKERIKTDAEFSLIYFCIDNYKVINDNYGHAYGDRLLKEIVLRMTSFVQEKGIVARIGGTEFVVVLDGSLDARETADDLLTVMREKAVLISDGVAVDVYTTCYAGLAGFPKDTNDHEELIKYADMSMLEALATKSKEVRAFDIRFVEGLNRQIEVEKLIKEGLENDYFYMVYQPQYHMEGKKLRGFESLIRMKTPDGRFISPGEFIPAAEKGDMIVQIDDYVLRRVMREFKDIVRENTSLIVSVNLSAKNVGSEDFVVRLCDIISNTQFSPENLEIEITEYCMVDSMDVTVKNITKLREMGIKVALDDFGTGYTSLNYVAKLPINLLKIDKSLIDDIELDKQSREFVHTVISMGHLMGCEVIAEGVESEGQLECLKANNCDFVQGYVWGKPLDYSVACDLALGN